MDLIGHALRKDPSNFFVGAVLHQSGKQQVPGFKQGQVLFIFDLTRWQQPGRFEVQKRRCNN
ncbi:unannotated protein [freshwater metagenome]|uniref:Unannotated protein n=1 Tax=freshwater metagenome TaxID=449393 RepID=A0A6J6BTQ9_9ZZZZ